MTIIRGKKDEISRKTNTVCRSCEIKVSHLERSTEFYKKILGFDILEQTSSKVKLTTDGKTSFLSLVEPEKVIPKQEKTTGLYHFAILLPTVTDLANIVVHLLKKGIRFASADHLVSEALYLYDPDGNGIEIYCDRPANKWTWRGSEVDMDTIPLNFDRLLPYATPNNEWRKMPEKTVMGHIHLHVSELIETEKFYVQGLGMDVVNRYGGQALFLSYGKYHHHVGVNTWNGIGAPQPPINSVGLDSFALIFHHEGTCRETVQRLIQMGANVIEENSRIFTFDPSGNKIELAI